MDTKYWIDTAIKLIAAMAPLIGTVWAATILKSTKASASSNPRKKKMTAMATGLGALAACFVLSMIYLVSDVRTTGPITRAIVLRIALDCSLLGVYVVAVATWVLIDVTGEIIAELKKRDEL